MKQAIITQMLSKSVFAVLRHKASSHKRQTIVLFSLHTGLRAMELAALKLARCLMKMGVILVPT